MALTAPATWSTATTGSLALGSRLDGDQRYVGGRVQERLARLPIRRDDQDPLYALSAQPLDRVDDRGRSSVFRLATMMK